VFFPPPLSVSCSLGIKCVRIPFNLTTGSYESLVSSILECYLPPDHKPVNANDYVVKLNDFSDKTWPIDIASDVDLQLATKDFLATSNGFVSMSVSVNQKNEPPVLEIVSSPPAATATSSPVDIASNAEHSKRIVSPARKSATPKRRKTTSTGGAGVTRGGKGGQPVRARIICSIAELRALGKPNPPRIEVALFAGYSNASSKGFSNPLSSLKTEGIVDYPDKKSVCLTPYGLETPEAKAIVPPRDNAEVQTRLKALLTPKQVEIFDLLAADGRPHLREEVAAAVGYSNPSSKGYANAVGKMSTLGLVVYPADSTNPRRKWVQLSDMCFPFSKTSATSDPSGGGFNLPTPPHTAVAAAAAAAPFPNEQPSGSI